ncbi:MAG: type II toxin-antitoxin system mRNA interferase toxin, RelE/StbE family [Crocosphaera sp.]|nr:type II toxin-antitoxin system mRNA interferase toxin, RelE/StbE family [Crocosphaera sp.]
MELIYTKQFEKDVKKLTRRGKNMEKIKIVINKLSNQEKLELRYKDHQLIGNYKERRRMS